MKIFGNSELTLKTLGIAILASCVFQSNVFAQSVVIGRPNKQNVVVPNQDTLFKVNIEDWGPSLVRTINPEQIQGKPTVIEILNDDLSLRKSITVPIQGDGLINAPYNSIFYISRRLFDLDDGIEYLLADGEQRIRVYDESGELLLSKGGTDHEYIASVPLGSYANQTHGPVLQLNSVTYLRILVRLKPDFKYYTEFIEEFETLTDHLLAEK